MVSKTEKKKKLIMDSFKKLIFEYGISKVTLKEIAENSGMSKSGFYYYFKTKEDLILEIFRNMVQSAKEKIDKTILNIEDPREKLILYIEIHLKMFFDDNEITFASTTAEIFEDMQKYFLNTPELIEYIIELNNEETQFVTSLLKEIYGDNKNDEEIFYKTQFIIASMKGITFITNKFYHFKDKFNFPLLDNKNYKKIATFIVNGV